MVATRTQKAFIQVLNALAELEALSSNDAFAGTEAWLAQLQRRLARYLTLTGHPATSQPDSTARLMRALALKVEAAVTSGSRGEVFSAAAELRNELAAHLRSLQQGQGQALAR